MSKPNPLDQRIAAIIERQLSYINGWYVDEKTLTQDCLKAARKIVRVVRREKSGEEEKMLQAFDELLKAIDHNRSLSPIEKLNVHLAACVPLLDAFQPAPDADARTRQEWAALRDAVERSVMAAKNIKQ